MTDIDVAAARAMTPGCEHVVHLNHAGASLLPQPVLDGVIGHLEREAATGGYEAADEATDRIEAVYRSLARLLGAAPEEIALTDSATRSWQLAMYSLPLRAGDRVLVGRAEYASNAIALLQLQERTGCRMELVEDDGDGQIDLDALEHALVAGGVAVVSLVHVPTSGGLVNPAEEVGRLCQAHGALLVLDACQSAGQLPLDVTVLGCAVLTGTGRKFLRGPRGTGFLYVRRDVLPQLEPVVLDMRAATWVAPDRYVLREDARRFEVWEADVAARLGLGAAVDHALDWGLDAIEERNTALAQGLRARLADIRGVVVHDKGARRCAITTFTIDGREPAEVQHELRASQINVSTVPATSAQLDLPNRNVEALIRASVHYTTTEQELDGLAARVSEMAG